MGSAYSNSTNSGGGGGIPENSKKQNLNLLNADNHLCNICMVLDIINNLDMM